MPVTPISDWIEQGDEVMLPTCKRVVLVRQLDFLALLVGDGTVPNFLLKKLFASAKTKQAPEEISFDAEEMAKLSPILNKLCEAMLIHPAIVRDMDAVREGKGILVSMIPLPDKLSLFAYAMGGEATLGNVERFPEQQAAGVDAVRTHQTDRAKPSDGVGDNSA